MVWDEETIRLLRDLWAQGHSTAEIGRRLGVSKNAIVGKAHRLELDARPSPIRRDVVKSASERPLPCLRAAGPTLPPLPSANIQAFSAAPAPSSSTAFAPSAAGTNSAASFTGTRRARRSTSGDAVRSDPEPPSGSVLLLANRGTRHQVVPILR